MSAHISIATLSKSSIPIKDIIRFLYTIETKSIKQYFELHKVYRDINRNKKKD